MKDYREGQSCQDDWMMKIQKKILTLLLLTQSLLANDLSKDLSQEKVIMDRLIVEIDHIAFTQVQMESYLLVVALLSQQKLTPEQMVVSAEDWEEKLKNFVVDMTIDQEALRSGGYEPNVKMIDQARQLFASRIESDSLLSDRLRRLQIDGIYRDRLLTQSLRVESYRRARQRQASVERSDSSVHTGTRLLSWIKELEQRAVVRFFSRQYMRIHD